MAVGDNAELFLTGSVAVRFDDNIFLTATNETSDTIASFTPGFELVFGKGSATKGNVYYREEFQRYSDTSRQNTSLSSLGFNSNYDNGKTKMGLAASFAQIAANEPGLTAAAGTITRREVTGLKANTEFAFSEKTSFGAGIAYDKTDYSPVTFTDSSAWSLPVDVYYEMTPKLDMSVGYRYRDTTLSGSASDTKEHFLNVGARGEFTPKLTGQIRVGYNKRSFDRGSDQTGFGADGALSYAASQKTTLQFTVSNDFSNSATGQSTKVFSRGISARSLINEQWSFGANLNFRSIDYDARAANVSAGITKLDARSEDYFEGGLNVSYAYSTYLNFGATYSYKNNDSTAAGDFKNSVFTFGANVRY